MIFWGRNPPTIKFPILPILFHWHVPKFLQVFCFVCFCFCFGFLGPHLWHTEVPRLGVKSEPQLPAYAIAAATLDLSHTCNLHHSSRQGCILNPLNKARIKICVLMDTSRVPYPWATMGTPPSKHFMIEYFTDIFPCKESSYLV